LQLQQEVELLKKLLQHPPSYSCPLV
jgi:hypothetical protein